MSGPPLPTRRRQLASWTPITRLDVDYQDDGDARRVGGLVLARDGQIYFQYDGAWLESGLELSPLLLPLSIGQVVIPAPHRRELHGLHGVFADALPDTWGMQFLQMALRRQGINPERAGTLDRLAYMGGRTMGALTFRPSRAFPRQATRAVTLDRLAQQADQLVDGRRLQRSPLADGQTDDPALDALERAAGSAGGAQPKVLIALKAEGQENLVAGVDAPPGYTSYLLKFTPRRGALGLRTDAGVLEEAYARMARAAGIDVPPTRLVTTGDGRQHFAVERFDRTARGGRRHVHTLGGILGRPAGDDGDYDELLRIAVPLTENVETREAVLRRLCFNVAVLNDDDHLKNTAFLLEPPGSWRLSPAYDLTYAPSHAGERGMAVAGHERDVRWTTIEDLAARHGVASGRMRQIRADVESTVAQWPTYAEGAGVPPESVDELTSAFEARRQQLTG